jgi:hypothetical protein
VAAKGAGSSPVGHPLICRIERLRRLDPIWSLSDEIPKGKIDWLNDEDEI